ncbi:MAG: hypothetical protein AOA65_1352 [Candidatus Bathyarchaeota archaeon BA1]|nr:MAG: hypothetical protein AOA65_1352 [Candidatus Bathyarchaeota archaeon BA1]
MNEGILKLAQEITMKKSPEEALSLIVRSYLEQRIAEYEGKINGFERKYRMCFDEFGLKLNDDESERALEEEFGDKLHMDYMEWEAYSDGLKILKSKLSSLQ